MTLEAAITGSIDACRADLSRVASDLKWALEPGLNGPPAAGDRRGTGLTVEELEDPDRVPGPKWALDIGDPRLRAAFVAGVRYMRTAEMRLVLAVHALDTAAPQSKPVRPSSESTFAFVDVCRMAMERRLTIIERDLPLTAHTARRAVAKQLHGPIRSDQPSARQALDLAVRRLDTAFARGSVAALWEPEPIKEIAASKRCAVCDFRKKARRWAPRCSTCGQYLKRNGVERPRYLDGINPREAAAKRAARGEGWGAA